MGAVKQLHKPSPSQGLWGGIGTAESRFSAFGGYTTSIGSYRDTTRAWGTPTELPGGIFFHFLAGATNQDVDDRPMGEVWLSVGDTIDFAGTGGEAILDFLYEQRYRTVIVKKSNNGAYFSGELLPTHTVQGNAVKIAAILLWSDHYERMLMSPGEFWGLYLSGAPRAMSSITMLRDAVVHLRPREEREFIRIEWLGIYNWETNEESLWVQDDKGNLLSQIRIPEYSEKGYTDIPMEKDRWYTLHIPGYSYRNYEVYMTETTEYLLEPAKLHFTRWIARDTRYYFKIMPGERAVFCMKDYNRGPIQAPYGVKFTHVGGDTELQLIVSPKQYFYEYDMLELPVSDVEQEWRVDFLGEGRAGFWLDGIPNLFADRLSWYSRPPLLEGNSTIKYPAGADSVGHYPNVGHYMSYNIVPEDEKPLLESLKAQCANIYTFADAIMREGGIKDRERIMRQYMSQGLKLERDYTILANTGRVAVVDYDNDPNMRPAMEFWIDNIWKLQDGKEHYIAAADEPNLNYPSYDLFETHFDAFARHFKEHPKTEEAGIKIAAVASSRFDHGTTIEDSDERRGELWLSRLMETHSEYIDAIVWHDWTVRGLLNLRQYSKTVEAAYKYSDNGRRRLAIEQTNTAGGSSVSLYDQNTHFASLWWASVFINTARTGKLDDLMWFPIFDERLHPKGLLFLDYDTDTVSFKPVAYFHQKLMTFLHGYDKQEPKKVYHVELPHIELDAVVIENDRYVLFMAVNKAKRVHELHVTDLDWDPADIRAEVFTANTTVEQLPYTYNGSSLKTAIPPEGIVFIYRDKGGFLEPLQPPQDFTVEHVLETDILFPPQNFQLTKVDD